jgi:hypothetical protein
MLLDETGWLSKYKLQPGMNEPPSPLKLAETVKSVIINQIFISTLFIASGYYSLQIFGPTLDLERFLQVPSFERIILELCFSDLVYEVSFYYSHRYANKLIIFERGK